jgi:predicted neuraminidase
MKQVLIASKGEQLWQGIPTIERTAGGRLWCAFFSGGAREPDPANRILLTSSQDDGATWARAECVIDPPGATRAYDPCLWIDPLGRLWLFYNTANLETHRFGAWAIRSEQAEQPVWSEPIPLDLPVPFCFRINKPTVLESGDWILPVTWADHLPGDWLDASGKRFAGTDWFVRDGCQGVAISADQGRSWSLHGQVKAPHWALENMVVEKQDGTLWMLIRTGAGVLWQSFSQDGGKTWTPGTASELVNPGSRFFIRRLGSGRLLLINTEHPRERKGLVASLSQDEQSFQTWAEIDMRSGVSYPDAVEGDGQIYIVYDHDRYGVGAIHLAVLPAPVRV